MNTHPKSFNRQENIQPTKPFSVFRSLNEEFFRCTHHPATLAIEAQQQFDVDEFKEMMRTQLNGNLPDGYYLAHLTPATVDSEIGEYLNTDNFDLMMIALGQRNLV